MAGHVSARKRRGALIAWRRTKKARHVFSPYLETSTQVLFGDESQAMMGAERGGRHALPSPEDNDFKTSGTPATKQLWDKINYCKEKIGPVNLALLSKSFLSDIK